MQYRQLGHTDLSISLIGLGTMTWGEQNSEHEAHEQLDVALEAGVNFVDVAEMYPVPPKPETQGLTEKYLGTWLKNTGRRQDIILASKVAGPVRDPKRPGHIRNGKTNLDRANLELALDASLKRLQTDYLDLYQLHWPDRTTATFGRRAYPWREDEQTVAIAETLDVLADFIRQGKVRHIGVSNETAWGVAQFLSLAKYEQKPLIASIQNPFNLLNRQYEESLSEFSRHTELSLLAYSPLAMGVLSGKYDRGLQPAAGRLTRYDRFTRYDGPHTRLAAQKYNDLAKQNGLSPAQMALAWVNHRPYVASNIIGATTLKQLKENIDSIQVQLDEDVLRSIDSIHHLYPNPAP